VREKFPTAELYATHLVAQLLDVQRQAQVIAAADDPESARKKNAPMGLQAAKSQAATPATRESQHTAAHQPRP
jgi:hypothetical protein